VAQWQNRQALRPKEQSLSPAPPPFTRLDRGIKEGASHWISGATQVTTNCRQLQVEVLGPSSNSALRILSSMSDHLQGFKIPKLISRISN
jgi:hypothetical protein